MTTIAYKNGVIAYDSRMTAGDTILTDRCDKHTVVRRTHFFYSGTSADLPALLQAYFGEEHAPAVDGSALVVDEGQVWLVSTDKDGLWRERITYPYALGSGTDFALAAMDCGLDAAGAVKIAIGRDPYSGGRVRKFKVQ